MDDEQKYMTKRQVVVFSPFLVIGVNFGIAYMLGTVFGKWVFIPMIATGWVLWLFFIAQYGGQASIKAWLKNPIGSPWWAVPAILIGLIPLPLFIFHAGVLSDWAVWVPWVVIALANPWIEEGYWRGLLMKYMATWPNWAAVLYSSALFSINHAAFGIHSTLNSGFEVIASTLAMGIVWAIVYKQTNSLRWPIFAHFLVDFLGLSAAAFLDLWEKGAW